MFSVKDSHSFIYYLLPFENENQSIGVFLLMKDKSKSEASGGSDNLSDSCEWAGTVRPGL